MSYPTTASNRTSSDTSSFVRLPCRIGDTVYAVRDYHSVRKVQPGTVSEMYFVGRKMELCIVVRNVARGVWGKTVFADEADCRAEIEKRKR